MKKKSKCFNEPTYIYGTGTYLLGISVVFFINILVNTTWYLNLFFLLCFLPMSMLLISKSKRMSRELMKKKIKKVKKK